MADSTDCVSRRISYHPPKRNPQWLNFYSFIEHNLPPHPTSTPPQGGLTWVPKVMRLPKVSLPSVRSVRFLGGAQSDASGGALSDAGAVLRVSSTFNT